MDSEERRFWNRTTQRRYTRRAVMRGMLLAGPGMAAAAALACKGSTANSGSKPAARSQAPSGGAAPSQLASLDARTGTKPAGQPVRGGTLNWYLTGNPPTLDPTGNQSTLTIIPASAVYSRLFHYTLNWDVIQSLDLGTSPDLATSAESPDAVTWTVKLRPGAKFQDIPPVNGHAVEAEDVKQSFLKGTAPQSVNHANLGFVDPNQIQTPDKQTIIFKLKYPFSLFVASGLASRFSWIFPREATDGGFDPATKMIGSGPWILDSLTPDVAEIYKRNPDYYDTGKPYIDEVRVAIISDVNARQAQFTGGHTEYLSGILPIDVPSVQQANPKAETIHIVSNANGIMYYDLAQDAGSPFLDIRLRQAVSLMVNRDAYAKASGFEPGKYVQTFIVSPGIGKWAAMAEDYPPETIQWYKYNPQKAKQLFDAAGGSKLNIKEYFADNSPPGATLGQQGETVFSMLKQFPWELNYVKLDYTHQWINGGKGMGYPGGGVPPDGMAWWGPGAVGPTVDEYVYTFYDSKGAGNMMHLNDPQIDKLISKARATLKEDEQVQAYKDVQRYIASKAYVLIGMVNGPSYSFVGPRVQNYLLGDTVAPGLQWAQMWLTS